MLVLLYLPIGLLFVFSFNAGTTPVVPAHAASQPSGTRRCSAMDRCSQLRATRCWSRSAARPWPPPWAPSSPLAVLRFSFRGRRLLLALAGLPLLVPYVVLGVAFFLLFVTIDLPRSLLAVIVGHTVIAIPFADADPAGAPVRPRPGARGRGDGPRRELPGRAASRGPAADGPEPARGVADLLHRQLRRDRARHLPGRRRPDLPGLPLRAAALRAAAAGADRGRGAADARHRSR